MVLYAHAFAITGTPYHDQLDRISGGRLSFGRIGVLAFFAVSGFLVTQSLSRSEGPRVLAYALKRTLRIWPALIASTLVVAFLVGPLMTRRPLDEFFSFEGGWSPWWYTFDTLTFNLFSTVFGWHARVRDLFAGNPLNAVVNGSLWSLRFEVAMYVALILLAVVTRYRFRLVAVVGVLLSLTLWAGHVRLGIEVPVPDFWVFHDYGILVAMAPYFFMGSALYVFRDHIPSSTGAAVLMATLILLASVTTIGWIILPLTLPYIVIQLGTAQNLAWYGQRIGDYSYGAYILAFPVEQAVVALGNVRNPYVLVAIALPITLGLAALSWHLVEARALRLKSRISRNAAAVDGPPLPAENTSATGEPGPILLERP